MKIITVEVINCDVPTKCCKPVFIKDAYFENGGFNG